MGNGEAISTLLALHGANVVVADIDDRAGFATAESITSDGGCAIAVAADATQVADCQRVIERAQESFGKLDIVVNNQGVTGPSTSVVDMAEADWHHTFAVNVDSMMLVCKCALPAMSDGGSIVNMSSIGAVRWTERTAYAASKGAVLSFTIALAGQCAARGIRVNALVPGAVWTPLVMEEASERVAGDPAEIARIQGAAPKPVTAALGGHRVGYGLGGSLLGQRRVPLDHRAVACNRRRGQHRAEAG